MKRSKAIAQPFFAYVIALIRHWLGWLMSSVVLGVFLNIYERVSKQSIPFQYYAMILGVGLFVASFLAWRDEWTSREKAEGFLGEVTAVREERLRDLHRPVRSYIDEVERHRGDAESLLAADHFEQRMDNFAPPWDRLHERALDVADEFRDRSERVYDDLIQLRPALQPMRQRVQNVVGWLRNRGYPDPRNDLRTGVATLEERLATVRRSLDLVF